MSVQDLYQQVILEHNKRPRNFGKLEGATHEAEGFNPVCGDHLWVYLQISAEGIIENVGFEGSGCAISKASASMMTVALKGKSVEDAQSMFSGMHDLLTGTVKEGPIVEGLGKLKIFAGIWQYPARVKCAALSWHTMNGAVKSEKIISTE